jgi:Tfp pilus assembly protein PilV
MMIKPLRSQRGFTLAESIVAFCLMGTAALGIISMQRGLFNGQSANRDLIQANALMEECAERLLSVRRVSGYSSVATTSCSSIATFGSFSAPTITFQESANSSAGNCVSASGCTAVVSISKGGTSYAPLTIQFQNY